MGFPKSDKSLPLPLPRGGDSVGPEFPRYCCAPCQSGRRPDEEGRWVRGKDKELRRTKGQKIPRVVPHPYCCRRLEVVRRCFLGENAVVSGADPGCDPNSRNIVVLRAGPGAEAAEVGDGASEEDVGLKVALRKTTTAPAPVVVLDSRRNTLLRLRLLHGGSTPRRAVLLPDEPFLAAREQQAVVLFAVEKESSKLSLPHKHHWLLSPGRAPVNSSV